MFYLSDSVFIAPLFLLLVLTVDRAKLKVSVGRCIGVEYPDIEKCTSVSVTPEAVRPNVQNPYAISATPVRATVDQSVLLNVARPCNVNFSVTCTVH